MAAATLRRPACRAYLEVARPQPFQDSKRSVEASRIGSHGSQSLASRSAKALMIVIKSHSDFGEPAAEVGVEEVRTLSGTYLVVFGELDIFAVDRLNAALAHFETAPDACGVSLQHVEFADSWGLEPIVESIRRSVARRRTPLRICSAAPAVRRVFDCLGVRWQPILDLAAWDAAAVAGSNMWLAANEGGRPAPLAASCRVTPRRALRLRHR